MNFKFLLKFFWACIAMALAANSAFAALPYLQVKNRRVVDTHGSTVILRGLAVNGLGDYFQANPKIAPTFQLKEQDFQKMASLGINSVRLVLSWSLLEPSPGVHDQAYLEKIKQAVEWAKANGIYVVLDIHQDAWGKYIETPVDKKCPWPLLPNIGWDGAPEWATITDNRGRCMLVHRELSMAVMNSWQAFWHDRDHIQQHLIDTWAWLAGEFKNDPAVIGYDLLNEPGWGFNIEADIHKNKPAFYGRATQAIRKAENGGLDKIIFFEPMSIWSAVPRETPTPFTTDTNIIYAPHIYLGSISTDMFLFHREIIPLRKGLNGRTRNPRNTAPLFGTGSGCPGQRTMPFDMPRLRMRIKPGQRAGSGRGPAETRTP